MSKRTDRIAKAKARSPEETAMLRKKEREKRPSQVAIQWIWKDGKLVPKKVAL